MLLLLLAPPARTKKCPEQLQSCDPACRMNSTAGCKICSCQACSFCNDEIVMSKHCHALSIGRLKKVHHPTANMGLVTLGEGAAITAYQRGHYPYRTCGNTTSVGEQVPMRPVILLMVANHAFRAAVPQWASHARAAGVQCALGSIGADQSACALAEKLGCRCLREGNITDVSQNASGNDLDNLSRQWHGARKYSVRRRFEFARQLLAEGSHSVLMHDADVFFKAGGLQRFLSFLSRLGGSVDLAVSDNHRRDEAFDDLNWGMVWMSHRPAVVQLLGCLLDEWDHAAFSGKGSYYRRSQPRVNHLIEAHLSHSSRHEQRLRVCKLSMKLGLDTFVHFSSFSRVRSKLICATAAGLLSAYLPELAAGTAGADDSPLPALAYQVPSNATIEEQQRALGAALAVAGASGRALALPTAFSRKGREVRFCSLFSAGTIPPHAAVLPPAPACQQGISTPVANGGDGVSPRHDGGKRLWIGKWIGGSFPASRWGGHSKEKSATTDELQSVVRADQTSNSARPSSLCIDFKPLLQLAGRELGKGQQPYPHVRVCPTAPVACRTTLEAPAPGASPRKKAGRTKEALKPEPIAAVARRRKQVEGGIAAAWERVRRLSRPRPSR